MLLAVATTEGALCKRTGAVIVLPFIVACLE